MRRVFTITIAFLLTQLVLTTNANPVDMRTAREVAMKFVNANANQPLRGEEDLQHLTTYRTEGGDAAFHIFNTPNGFVIVSADDCATPILGYSDEGRSFDPDNIPIQLQGYLQGFVEQIQYGIENHVQDETTTQQWELVRSTGRLNNNRDGEAVEPLITTQWGQGGVYGSMCPNGIVGCGGVAVAQIMNYWKYPERGVGYVVDYNGNEVYFNETTYLWDSIYTVPDALPTLMYHAAAGIFSMFYTNMPIQTGSYFTNTLWGMQLFFDYNTNSHIDNKDDYAAIEWITRLKNNLNDSVPLIYSGGNAPAHSWVCDGYDENNLFHMNWGWEGGADGWYTITALYAATYDFNEFQYAIFDLSPMYSSIQAQFEYTIDQASDNLVYFYDFSKNAADSYCWDFGDGSISTLTNPVHQYDTSGYYTVSLVVNKDGMTDSCSKTISVINNSYFEYINNNLSEVGYGTIIDYNMDGLHDVFFTDYSITNNRFFSIYRNCDSISSLGFSFKKIEDFAGLFESHDGIEDRWVVDFLNENEPSIIGYGFDTQNNLSWFYFDNNDGMLENDTSYYPPFFEEKMLGDSYLYWQEDDTIVHQGFKVFDYNNDGLSDVVVGSRVYKNIGNGLFHPIDSVFPKGISFIVDIDKDGDIDVFSKRGLYVNSGKGEYRHCHFPKGIIEDFNGDGRYEILTTLSDRIEILKGDIYNVGEDSLFMIADTIVKELEFNNGPVIVRRYDYEANADIDNDGIVDIIASQWHYSDMSFVYNLIGNQIIQNEINGCTINNRGWIDYDHNDAIDLMLGNSLFKNKHLDNSPPSPPTNLLVQTMGNDAFLSWDASFDDHTYSEALNYNIAVGSAPDSCDIISPLSNLITGKRYVVTQGNAGKGTVWRINDLPNGVYYWRVQAIDQAFAASPFSEMGTFTIYGNNIRPVIAPITMNCYMNKPNTFSQDVLMAHYSDRDKDTLQLVMITQLPIIGSLYLGGETVVEGQLIPIESIDELYYITNSPGQDTCKLKAYDGKDFSDYETVVSFHTVIFEQTWKWENNNGDITWGDYNNDGQLDILSSGGLYKNVNGFFINILDSVPTSENVYFADVNDDGLLDAIFSETILLNADNDVFIHQTELVNQDLELSDIADVNNDNKIDYLITSPDNNKALLYYNTGEGFREDSVYIDIPTAVYGEVKFADIDNDGHQDFAITGWRDHEGVYWNHNEGFYKTECIMPELAFGSLDWGDYDNDGDLDLIASGHNGSTFETVILNNYHGVLSVSTTHNFPGVYYGQVRWIDFNGDGMLDVLLVGHDGTNTVCYLYKNNGDLSFNQIPFDQIGICPLWFSNLSIADYDGDGYQDIAISGMDDKSVLRTFIYRNSYGSPTLATNTPPSPPSNLQCVVQGNHISLTWDDSYDNTTPQNDITYNIYIRNDDTEEYVVSPLSNLQDGFRKVTAVGNCGFNNFMCINQLDAGTYSWSVQSIDNGLMSSTFAPEQTFTVDCSLSINEVFDTIQCVYYWNDKYYLNSTTAFANYNTAVGCDSLVIIHLQILQDSCWNPIYVTENGAGMHNGDSWENAMGDLQKAIDLAAMHGSSIWVKQGTYIGDTLQENAINLYGGVSLYGGFEGNEPADYNINQRNLMDHHTILDGQHAQRVLYSDDKNVNTLHYIDGFVLQNGKSEWYPGALLGDFSVLNNSLIRYNECTWNPVIHGAILGGMVVNSIITRNTMHRIGIRNSFLLNCVLANNTGVGYPTEDSYIRNCIIMDNISPRLNYSPNALNCAISFDSLPEGNMIISSDNDGDELNVNYVRFVDPDNDDYRLQPGSACINAGTEDNLESFIPSSDIQGNQRVIGGHIDIGPFEFDPSNYDSCLITTSVYPDYTGNAIGAGTYLIGQRCILMAVAEEGCHFCNWTKDNEIIATTPKYSFLVEESGSYVASFSLNNYEVNVSVNVAEGGTVTGSGIFNHGDIATIIAIPADGYTFVNWTENGIQVSAEESFTFTVTGNRNIIANFTNTPVYWAINASANPSGSGSITGMDVYLQGRTCILNATPNAGYTFINWMENGVQVSDAMEYSFTVSNDRFLTANFTNNPCYVQINAYANPSNAGLIDGPNTYLQGLTCTLIATPNPGYRFVNWTKNGTVISTNPSYSFTVTEDEVYVANYEYMGTFTINASASPIGTTTGGGSYIYGTTCTLTPYANSNSGYVFYCWTKGNGLVVSYDRSYSFTVTENATYVAHFIDYIPSSSGFSSIMVPNVSFANYSMTQQIYTNEEVGEAGAIDIIGFLNYGATETRDFSIYLVNTEKNSYSSQTDWIMVSPSDLVFSGEVTFTANRWNYIELETPFFYEGSNLAILVDDNTGNHSEIRCRAFDTDCPQSLCAYSENNNININEITNNPPLLGLYYSFKNNIALGRDKKPSTINTTVNIEEAGVTYGEGKYLNGATCVLRASANESYRFLNWTKDGEIVSNQPTFSFTVTEPATYTANFTPHISTQTVLPQGWTWWTPIVETSLNDIETSLGGKLQQINSQDNVPISSIIPGRMYKIQVSEPCTLALSGSPITSANIIIEHGYNWFGYIGSQPTMIQDFSISPFPANGDKIISQNEGFAIYEDYNWNGSLDSLKPGMGYGYISNAVENKALLLGTNVSTEDATNITCTSASIGGVVTSPNGVEITERGVCWSVNHNPTTNDSIYIEGFGTGNFSCNISGLEPNTTYYARAYAILTSGIAYGTEIDFITPQMPNYTITTSINPNIGGTVEGQGTYQHGEICNLSAWANEGYIFTNWTENDTVVSSNYVYSFTVTCNRNMVANFELALVIPTGAIDGLFSVSETRQVYFSQGNLQYNASQNTWRFAEKQWNYVGDGDMGNVYDNGTKSDNSLISATYDGWIDLFGWGTSGYDHGALYYQPFSTNTSYSGYYAYGNDTLNLYDQTGQADWGYNAISNGANITSIWRTLSLEEWTYLLYTRNTNSGIRFAKAQVNEVNGLIILPDDWNLEYYTLNDINTNNATFSSNIVTSTVWNNSLEIHGAIFLPITGMRKGTSIGNDDGYYWSASYRTNTNAYKLLIQNNNLNTATGGNRSFGFSVRLVQDY